MNGLFFAEETPDVSESPSPSGLGSSLAQTRPGRSASAAAPPSGLGRVFSSGAGLPSEPPSLSAPFEDRGGLVGLATIPASAPGRSGLAGPPAALQGITVGQALVAVVKAAKARDAEADAAVGALRAEKPTGTYCLRVSETDADEPAADAPETELFGSCGAPLTGPWTPDLDFPPLDSTALLSSIGISTFVVMDVAAGSGDGGLTALDVVHAQDDGDATPSEDETAAAGVLPSPSGTPAPGPWAGSGSGPLLRVRLPPSSMATHAGELRDGGRGITLIVERPSADGASLAARFTVSVTPAASAAEPGATDAPSAEELASSLMSGLLFMPKDS